MKIINFSIIFIFAFILFFAFSCERNSSSSKVTINPLDLTPRDIAEAEWAALYLSDEMVAPDSMYNKVLHGLNQLQFYASSVPEVSISFYYPTYNSSLEILFTDSAKIEIREGEYHNWDSLNLYYSVNRIDTMDFDGFFVALLSFEKRLNPSLLCEKYISLPGVKRVSAGGIQAGDRPKKYITLNNGLLNFLIRNAWGDCPAGCPYSHYFYFKQSEDTMIYIGDWNPQTTETPPEWWDEADDMFWEYAEYFRYFCGDTL